MTRTALIWVALCAFLMLEGRLLCIPISDAQAGTTSRVSVGIGGIQVGFASSEPAIIADGRYIAFASDARQLVPGDSNNKSDIFVHDRQTGQTTRVSIATGGGQAGTNPATIPPLVPMAGMSRSLPMRRILFHRIPTSGTISLCARSADVADFTRQRSHRWWPSEQMKLIGRRSGLTGRYVAFRSTQGISSRATPTRGSGMGGLCTTSRVDRRPESAKLSAVVRRTVIVALPLSVRTAGRYVAFQSSGLESRSRKHQPGHSERYLCARSADGTDDPSHRSLGRWPAKRWRRRIPP